MMLIAGMTMKELLRKRVLLITLLLTAAFLGLFAYGAVDASDSVEQAQSGLLRNYMTATLMLSLGLFFANFVAAFFVLFSTMGTISSELENGVLLAILARPISRSRIYMGKWIGFAVPICLFCTVLFGGLVGIVRTVFDYPLPWIPLLKALLLFLLAAIVLLCVSMMGSTWLPTLGNGVASALLFCLGLLGGLMERLSSFSQTAGTGMEKFGLLVSLVMPTDSLHRRMMYELLGGDLPFAREAQQMLGPFGGLAVPSGAFLIYSVLFCAVLVVWGCRHFTKRDI